MQEKSIGRINNLSEFLFLLFLMMLTLCKSIGLGNESVIYRIIFLSSLIVIVVKIMHDRWTKRQLAFLFLFFCVIVINYYFIRQETLLLSFFIILGAKGVPIRKTLTVILFTRIFGFFSTILAAMAGIIPNNPMYFWRGSEYIIRYGWGYAHPNLLHSSFSLIVILTVHLYYKKINLVELFILGGGNYFLYQITFSRTGFILVNILLILTFLSKSTVFFKTILLKITPHMQLILLVLTIILAYVVNANSTYSFLDELLTGRLSYAYLQLSSGISVFGKLLSGIILYDNSYSMMLSLYGLVISGILFLGYFFTARTISKKQDIAACLLFFSMSICLFTESYLPSAMMNYTLLFMTQYLYGEITNE